jgi:hypothetical protein
VAVTGWRLTAQRIQGRRIGRVRITPEPGVDEAGTARATNVSNEAAEPGGPPGADRPLVGGREAGDAGDQGSERNGGERDRPATGGSDVGAHNRASREAHATE